MDEKKQIEELSEILRKVCDATPNGKCISKLCCACRAETVIRAGYRKQIEAEWLKDRTSKFEHRYNCSNCNYRRVGEPTPHCPGCGAKMKGGEE